MHIILNVSSRLFFIFVSLCSEIAKDHNFTNIACNFVKIPYSTVYRQLYCNEIIGRYCIRGKVGICASPPNKLHGPTQARAGKTDSGVCHYFQLLKKWSQTKDVSQSLKATHWRNLREVKKKMLFFNPFTKQCAKTRNYVMQVELQLVKRECIVCGEIKRNKCDWIPLAAEAEVVKGGRVTQDFIFIIIYHLSQAKMTVSDINKKQDFLWIGLRWT